MTAVTSYQNSVIKMLEEKAWELKSKFKAAWSYAPLVATGRN